MPPTADRLSPLEARLLDVETRRDAPLRTGVLLLFDGPAPAPEELIEHVGARLALAPRYGRRLALVPLRQGRPLLVADAALRLGHHVHAEGLPAPGGEAELEALAGRILSRRLDRTKPLWEICLVDGLRPDGFALLVTSHAALADGERHPDLAGALLGTTAAPAQPPPAPVPSPPGCAVLLAAALAERARDPREALETLRSGARRVRDELERRDLDPFARFAAPPAHPQLRGGGPVRAFARLDADLETLRCARARLRATVNDLVLSAVAGALGARLRECGATVAAGETVRALVPLARAGGTGLLAAHVPLPVGSGDPRRRAAEIGRVLDGLRESGRAAPAAELSARAGFAPAGLLAAAARLVLAHPGDELALANVPGPRDPPTLLGRPLRGAYPLLPLAPGRALTIGAIGIGGRLCVGIVADPDAPLGDPTRLATLLRAAFTELTPT